MLFIDVTLKFRYKPIISNDYIYKTKQENVTVCVSFFVGYM